MAGAVTMTNENKRVLTVRPSKEFDEGDSYLLHDKPDEHGAEEVDDEKDDQEQWADIAKKVKSWKQDWPSSLKTTTDTLDTHHQS